MSDGTIDILEDTINQYNNLLKTLLIDRTKTTKRKTHNIIWATDSYIGYNPNDEIQVKDITVKNNLLIQPRISKSLEEQKNRKENKAEVFTPTHIVRKMNQQIDWRLGHWPVQENNWQDYVKEIRLEITCGEAPFIVNRYNAMNGKKVLNLNHRVGFLDRKLQVVSKYCQKETDWLKWAKIAFQCSYGYEWQGDSLLIARENLLYTFIDFYNDKFPKSQICLEKKNSKHHEEILAQIAEIISWNIFQMDGLKYVIPMTCKYDPEYNEIPPMLTLLEWKETKNESKDKSEKPKTKENCRGCQYNNPYDHNGTKVKVKDWNTGKSYSFTTILNDNQPTKK